ncbi:MAG: hypothetical protein IKG89_04335 [Oscillospiraceae bacterium]|nr:hypothetical protein [Oscillospiraceae bacterium]
MRDLAYRRAVIHSAAADYDHCGHLVTSGDPEAFWLSGDSGGEWLLFDLGGPCRIRRIRIAWLSCPAGLEVQIPGDGAGWRTVLALDPRPGEQTLCPGELSTDRLRLFFRMAPGERCGVRRVELFGEGETPALPESPWRIARAPEVAAEGAALSGEYDDSSWLPAQVPGTALSSWQRAGAVPEMDRADGQFQVSDRWFLTDFWYRRTFDAPEGEGRVWLILRQVNWKAELWLNGSLLGRLEGAFLRGRWDITALLKPRGNHLAIQVFTNATPGPIKVHTRETAGPNGGPLGADAPTIHAAAGWDWMPTVRGRNVGLIGPVELLRTKGRLIAEDPWVKTALSADGREARLTVACRLRNTGDAPCRAAFSGRINPGELPFASETAELAPGESRELEASLLLPEPRLWWPNTYGEPFLYSCVLTALADGGESDERRFPFGVRELRWTEDWPMKLTVNGVPILCRGGNWGMDDAFLRCTPEDYDIRVRFHRDMNFTMIRNWVGMVGREEFYDACDRYGILIWDDFWLANPVDGPDPEDEAMFLRNAEDKLRRVRRHPSVALYCARNEGFAPESLDRGLRALCGEWDGTRPYLPHSALGTVSGFGPYHSAGPEYYFGHTYHTLHSERGMVNIPSLESMEAMLGPEHRWPIDEVWALHDFCRGGAMRSDEFEDQLRGSYGDYDSLEEFTRLSQLLCYSNHKAMFEAVFAGKSQGLLMWMSNPAWPSTVWQTYDSRYDINGGFQGCRDGCRSINAVYDVLREELALVNATAAPRQLTLRMELFDLRGSLLRREERSFAVPACSAEYVMEAPRWMNETQLMRLTVLEAGREPVENNYWLNGWAHTDYRELRTLPSVALEGSLTKTEGGFLARVRNPGPVPALMAELRLKDPKTGKTILPVFSDRNFLLLLPGEEKTALLEAKAEEAALWLRGFNIRERVI